MRRKRAAITPQSPLDFSRRFAQIACASLPPTGPESGSRAPQRPASAVKRAVSSVRAAPLLRRFRLKPPEPRSGPNHFRFSVPNRPRISSLVPSLEMVVAAASMAFSAVDLRPLRREDVDRVDAERVELLRLEPELERLE